MLLPVSPLLLVLLDDPVAVPVPIPLLVLLEPAPEPLELMCSPARSDLASPVDMLHAPRATGDPCLSRSLTPDAEHQVACVVLEGRQSDNGSCVCDQASARRDVPAQFTQAKVDAMNDDASKIAGLDCFCEIPQLAGDELQACQYSLDEEPATASGPVDGWCYIDAATFPKTGEDQLVAHCDATERRTIRFVGKGEPVNKSLLFIKCNEASD